MQSSLRYYGLLSLTVLGTGLLVLAVRRKTVHQGGNNGDDDDDDDSFDWNNNNDKNNNNNNNDTTNRFPWEPDGHDQKHQKERTAYTFGPDHDVDDPQNQLQELDFLSAMTFANGGLRAPSCFCCQ